ncbi:PAS domain-containing sensor histidine kinase [Nocardioides marmoraquaticus]
MTDPSRRESVEDALRAEVVRFRAFFDDNPHAAFSLTPDGRFDEANAITEQHTGYTLEQLRGMRFDEVVDPVRLPQAHDTFAAVLAGEAQKVQTVVRTSTGETVDLNVTLVPVVVDGVVVAVQGLAEDMTVENTVLRALEQARREAEAADSAKTDFLANTSHEFRTPLASLLAAAELLAEHDLDGEQAGLLEVVQRSGLRLLALVDDVLDASRLTAGDVRLRTEPVGVAAVLDAVAAWAVPRARARGIGFRVVRSDDAPEELHGDPARLQQVLGHLVDNALKFTDSGAVTLRVATTDDGGGRAVVFEVEDTGTGFPEARLESLSRPFAQLDPTATRRHGGAGLGLTISRGLVSLMGGRLTASSTLGVGSTFRLVLPLTCPLADAP